MNKRMIFLEVWRNPYNPALWVAEKHEDADADWNDWRNWMSRDGWDYYFMLNGKVATVVFASQEAFTRQEAITISKMIVEQKGIKAWSLDLRRI